MDRGRNHAARDGREPSRAAGTPAAARFVPEAGAFLDAVGAELVGALTIRVGDRRVAEELAQEAIARAWADWPRVSTMANPTGWVYRVAFNLASSHWRRALVARRVARRDRDAERHVQLRTAESVWMRDAVSQLSDQQQRVVILRFYVGFDVRETAEVLGVSPGTVKTQTSRALARLRGLLRDGADD